MIGQTLLVEINSYLDLEYHPAYEDLKVLENDSTLNQELMMKIWSLIVRLVFFDREVDYLN